MNSGETKAAAIAGDAAESLGKKEENCSYDYSRENQKEYEN